jgi:predicted nucleotidyltransferase
MDSPLEKAIEIIVQVADPDKIILFGSRARGDNKKDSDYDICVIKRDVEHRRKLAQQIYVSFCDIGAPIDVIVQTPDKFDELKDDPYFVYKQIAKDGVTVYEKSMIGSERY